MRWASPHELYKRELYKIEAAQQEQRKGCTIHGLRTAWKTRNRYRR